MTVHTPNREARPAASRSGGWRCLGAAVSGTAMTLLLAVTMAAEELPDPTIEVERARFRPAAAYGPAVSDERYARLENGTNLNGWFCQPWNQTVHGTKGGFNREFLRSYISAQDIAMIAAAGFDHIRLPIDPLFLIDLPAGELKTDLLPELDRAIAMIREHGLALIVDIHPKNGTFAKMSEKPELCMAFVAWWGHFARHLATTTDPEWVFLETLNEPGGQHFWANQAWNDYQDQLITIIRAHAPEHTIIANGGAYQLVGELDRADPHPDRNLIWAVHYYGPSPFTHQGAVWMKDWYHPLNQLPWPLDADNLEQAIADLKPHPARDHAAQVLRDQVNKGVATPEALEREIAAIAAWAQAHDRRVHVGEYGVLDQAPRDSRIRYLAAITQAFERHGLGRAVWNFSGSSFGVFQGADDPGERRPDPEILGALGLALAGGQE